MNKTTIAVTVAAFLAGAATGWIINGKRLNDQIAEIQKQHEIEAQALKDASAEKEKTMREKAESEANDYLKSYEKNKKNFENLEKELRSVRENHMLDCRIDASRLRIIKDATQYANTVAR